MTNIGYRAIALSLLALGSLPGCQSLPFWDHQTAASEARDVDIGAYFDRRLADGRRHLDSNRLASAVTAFRQASYDPELAAAAHNGMAIAYDRLGRADLAERYFISAMRIDPANPRYSSNFALFSEAHMSEISERHALALAEEQAGRGERFSAPKARNVSAPSSRMRRVSAHEVHIAASSEMTDGQFSTRNDVRRQDTVNVQQRAARVADSENYPIRITLTSPESGENSPQYEHTAEPRRTRLARVPTARRHKGYPIRLVLSDGET